MTEAGFATFLRRIAMAGGASLALFAGFAAAPTIFARTADAQEIQPAGGATAPG